jgi:hypothetical protein
VYEVIIVRSKYLREGIEDDTYNCSCSIIVNPTIKPESGSLSEILDTYVVETPEGAYACEDLNPNDRINTEREIAIARIGREVFMGQAMFVVNIRVTSTRFKEVPFFAQVL